MLSITVLFGTSSEFILLTLYLLDSSASTGPIFCMRVKL